MYIAIKEKKKMYVAVTNSEYLVNMSAKDMLLEDNLTLWKIAGRKGWYMATARCNPTTDVLRYAKGLFAKEITYQTLLAHTIPKMKQLLGERDLIKDKYWYNELLIVNKDKAYVIDGYFCLREVVDFDVCDSRADVIRGCLEFNKNLPAKVRICEAICSVEEMRGKKHFPAILLDVATGKKEAWWSYEDVLKKVADEWTSDMEELYKKALQSVIAEQAASMSLLQRKLNIGYNKAGRLIERMEEERYIEEFNGGSSRKVFITKAQYDERFNG